MYKRFVIVIFTIFSSLMAGASDIFVESESFHHLGGWVVDQQFMDQMGSPYVMAHGMGNPLEDAKTTIQVEKAGVYDVYVRTYNWTSPWSDKMGPGRFVLTVNDKRLPKMLGAEGKTWGWQLAGKVTLKSGEATLGLHDLTGFDGRCDAIYLTTDPKKSPLKMNTKQTEQLRQSLNPIQKVKSKHFDFVVVGGGIAGMCAAVTAARLGSKVALVNDRPVLGGNNSSEVRVHLGGVIELKPNQGLGRMIREFGHERGGNAQPGEFYEDSKKDSFVLTEKNITLFPSYRAIKIKKKGNRISSVLIQQIQSAEKIELEAPLFSDCTGDGTIGFLAGADWRMGREAQDEYHESLAPMKADTIMMGSSIQWYSEDVKHHTRFPDFSYGINFNESNKEPVVKGEWTWETGMNKNPITDAERIRDYGLLVIYSNWSFLKNKAKEKQKYRNRSLAWVGYIAGKRESRRLLGDYVLSEEDINKNVQHEDASFSTSWSIDLHFADSLNSVRFPGNEFKTRTVHRWIYPYAVPYRCLYSRNIDNLLMAGRNISCTHVALGTVRVMRTTGMMGEVVGMAAALCHQYGIEPRDVYRNHLPELKVMMQKGIGKKNVPDNQHFNEPNVLLEKPRAFMNQ